MSETQVLQQSNEITKLRSVLTTRGDTFNLAEAMILKAKYNQKPLDQDDDAIEIPQLEHVPNLTYKKDQYALVQDELAERRKPKIQFQPLYTQNITPKTLNEQIIFPNRCLPDQAYYTFDGAKKYTTQEMAEMTKYYQKIEEEQQINPPKRSLVYHKLVQPATKQFYVQKGCAKDTLKFEGRYEGGNIYMAVQQYRDPVYEIYVYPDAFTAFHCIYFNFQICNFQPNVTYTFKIMNLSKQIQAVQPFFCLNGKIFPFGEKISTYRSNQRQKTILFYNHVAKPEDFKNVEDISGEDEFVSALKAYKNFQKKAGFTKKMISKKLCQEELNFNMYRYIFQFTLTQDMLPGYDIYNPQQPPVYLQICSTLPVSFKNTLIYCQSIADMVFKDEDGINIEVRQLCRSYLGNSVPVIKVFSKSDLLKDVILVMSRVQPDDGLSQVITQGFLSQLMGTLDHYYTDELEKIKDEDPVVYQNLLQKYQQETAARKFILSQFVFYIIPCFDVDGQVMGQHRVNFFNQDYNRCFGIAGSFKNPQMQFINTLTDYCKETGIKIAQVYDIKTSYKTDKLIFNCNQKKSYKDLNMKFWEILGSEAIVPVPKVPILITEEEIQAAQAAQSQDGKKNQVTIKYFDDLRTVDGFQKVETFFDDVLNAESKVDIARQLREAILDFCKENNNFAEFAEFALMKKEFPNFSFSDSTFTVPPPLKEKTARAYFFQAGGASSYQVVAPRTLDSEGYIRCGRELCRFIQFKYMQDGEQYKEQIEYMQIDYVDNVKSAILSAFTNGQIKFLDKTKYTPAQLQKLPVQLKMLSQLEDQKYDNFKELNDRTGVRRCLQVNKATDTMSDSDDSEVDMEAASGKPKKVSPEEKKLQQDKRNFIRDMMANAYPELQQKPKSKKGGRSKSKK